MKNNLLGKQVICYVYLKKRKGLYYVFANEKSYRRGYTGELLDDPKAYIMYNNESIGQRRYEFIECKPFKGIIVAKLNFPVSYRYDVVENRFTGDPIDEVRVTRDEYIECYKVYYGLNRSRIVPVKYCELINGGNE